MPDWRMLLAGVLLAMTTARGAIEPQDFDSPEQAQRYQALLAEVRCMVCPNQSLAASSAGLAADLREAIRRLINEGASDADIRAFLSERYGDYILYRPPLRTATLMLWLGPPLLLLLAGGAIFVVLRRRGAPAESDDG